MTGTGGVFVELGIITIAVGEALRHRARVLAGQHGTYAPRHAR